MSLVMIFALFLTAPEPLNTHSPPAKQVLRLEAIKVEGRIQKPQAFYILQRSNLNFEGLERKESFIPNIVKAIDAKPF